MATIAKAPALNVVIAALLALPALSPLVTAASVAAGKLTVHAGGCSARVGQTHGERFIPFTA